jgi:hypothetical protein
MPYIRNVDGESLIVSLRELNLFESFQCLSETGLIKFFQALCDLHLDRTPRPIIKLTGSAENVRVVSEFAWLDIIVRSALIAVQDDFIIGITHEPHPTDASASV